MGKVYYVYIDVETNTTEILHEDKIITIDGIDIMAHINLSQKTLVFTNFLYYLQKRYPGGETTGEFYMKYGNKEPLEYVYERTTLRNIACFTSGQTPSLLKEIYPDLPMTKAMEKYILSINEDPTKVKYTLGYHVKKNFYEDIADELWNFKKEHKAYYYDLNTYNDMMVANKAGALSDVHIYEKNVLCFDKRSAYASVMVNDAHFPIGKMKKSCFENPSRAYNIAKRFLKEETYFKIVLDYVVPGFEEYFDEDAKKTGLEYENFLDLQEDGKLDIFFDNIKNGKLYYCMETGRLPYALREKIIQLFNDKEKQTGVQRFFTKTCINILYGKGIQEYNFETKQDLQNHYKGRGENYLNPEQSLHCLAVVLHEIHKAIRNNIAIYWDTDGIKVKDTPEAREYFAEQNNIIQHKNLEAGFESDIGTWKLEDEAQEFISFGGKRYIIQDHNGNYDMTWAGVASEDQQRMLKMLGKDKIQKAKQKPFPEIRRVVILDPDDRNRIKQRNHFNPIIFNPKQ